MVAIIAIEGLDGVGKTTLCGALQDVYKDRTMIEIIKSPHRDVERLAYAARSGGKAGSLCAFTIANCYLAKSVTGKSAAIVDRYFLSTLVHHHEVAAEYRNDLISILRTFDYQKPHLTIVLEADLGCIQSRLEQRKNDRQMLVGLEVQHQRYSTLQASEWQQWIGPIERRTSATDDDFRSNIEYIKSRVDKICPQ